ncbi:tetratricopeptide repeat protein [Nitrosomonas ureae]|nr:tetratricopeptide repeat protein [Nitrosomonas ureae]
MAEINKYIIIHCIAVVFSFLYCTETYSWDSKSWVLKCGNQLNEKNMEIELEICAKEAHEGSVRAAQTLSIIYEKGVNNVIKNNELSKRWRDFSRQLSINTLPKLKANAITAEDHYKICLYGYDVAEETFDSCLIAAENDYVNAQLQIAFVYDRRASRASLGSDDPNEKLNWSNEALKWHKKAAELGDAYAQYEVARTVDEWGKEHWYRKAAHQGHILAMYELAKMIHEKGRPDVESIKWYQKAAESQTKELYPRMFFPHPRGDVSEPIAIFNSQFELGNIYHDGILVPQNFANAIYWYKRAAESDHPKAQLKLGKMYTHDSGADQDDVSAYMWFSIVATHGWGLGRDAMGERDNIAKRMTPTQINIAQKKAAEWFRDKGFDKGF